MAMPGGCRPMFDPPLFILPPLIFFLFAEYLKIVRKEWGSRLGGCGLIGHHGNSDPG